MKIKKHIWKFGIGALAVTVPAVALTSCGGSGSSAKLFAEIVVSNDLSTLLDKSFSETTYNGFRNFVTSTNVTNEFGTPDNYDTATPISESDIPATTDASNPALQPGGGLWRKPNEANRNLTFQEIYADGANLVIAPGYNHQTTVESVASQFKDKGILFLDGKPDIDNGDFTNVASFQFRAEQSGFLTGIATAEFLNANKDVFMINDNALKVGGFVGLALPSTVDFLTGFQQGIIAFNIKNKDNPDVQQVEWVNLGSNIDDYSSGNFNASSGDNISRKILLGNNKADAIIPIAGPQTSDAIKVVTDSKDHPAIVVGVDSIQEEQPGTSDVLDLSKFGSQYNGKSLKDADGNVIDNPKVIQFSAIKKLDQAVYKTLAAIFNTEDPNNENNGQKDKDPVKGFGYNNIGTLSNSTVGISPNGVQWIKKFDQTYVTQQGNEYVVNGVNVLQNETMKKMYTNKVLYQDIKNLTSVDLLGTESVVTSSIQGLATNKTLTDMPTSLTEKIKKDGSTSLNGSNWSFERGKTVDATKTLSLDTRRKEN